MKRGIQANQQWMIQVGDLVAKEHKDSSKPIDSRHPWYPFQAPWSPAQVLALSHEDEEEGYLVHVHRPPRL